MAQVIEVWTWFTEITLLSFGVVIGLIIVIIHTRYLLLDLIKTGSSKPNQKINSKALNLLSLTIYASIICYLLGMIQILENYLSELLSISQYCAYSWFVGGCIYFSARMFTYLAFLLRLHIVYEGSAYQYNRKLLILLGIIVIIYASGVSISVFIDTYPYTNAVYNPDWNYVMSCVPDPNMIPKRTMITVCLYDLGFSIGFIIAFINPLRKMVKHATDQKQSQNLIQSGLKCFILVSISVMTTFIMLMVTSAGFTLFHAIDHVTNIICVILMTKYYRKQRIYSKLCCGPIIFTKWCMACCCKYRYHDDIPNLVEIVNKKEMNTPTQSVNTLSTAGSLDIVNQSDTINPSTSTNLETV